MILGCLPRQEEAAHTGRIEESDRVGVDAHRSDPSGRDGRSDRVSRIRSSTARSISPVSVTTTVSTTRSPRWSGAHRPLSAGDVRDLQPPLRLVWLARAPPKVAWANHGPERASRTTDVRRRHPTAFRPPRVARRARPRPSRITDRQTATPPKERRPLPRPRLAAGSVPASATATQPQQPRSPAIPLLRPLPARPKPDRHLPASLSWRLRDSRPVTLCANRIRSAIARPVHRSVSGTPRGVRNHSDG